MAVEKVLGLDEVRLDGLKVLFRADLNLPLDPNTKRFLDDTRMRMIVPSLKKLERSSVVILAHQSRPGRYDFTDMRSHSERLSKILERDVNFVPDICGKDALHAIESLKPGGVLILDNIRIHRDENEMRGQTTDMESSEIVQKLAPFFDLFVNDAFGSAHRSSPSLIGFTRLLPSVAGSLLKREIDALSIAVDNPPRPYVAILGGAKADDSLGVASNLLEKEHIDKVVFLGVVGNFMLLADGVDIGLRNANFAMNQVHPNEEVTMKLAKRILSEFREKIILPEDLAIEVNEKRVQISLSELPTEHPIYDVGIGTLKALHPIIRESSCVLWNGPASYFEKDNFAFGTVEVLNMVTETNAMTIIGGGHTSALVEARGASGSVTHNSSGGGATLTMLSGGDMPVIRSLTESYEASKSTLSERNMLL